jgi:4-aminobutyrate aminotransferase-like enzyme
VCAQGAAVLDVIDREKLQANALKIGNQIFAGLERLKAKYDLIGDVRGKGLLLGIELVKDRATKEPATSECAHVLESCRDMGLLLGKGGLYGQTIRFSPLCAFTNKMPTFCWMYRIEHLAPSEGKSGVMSPLKIQHQHTHTGTLMRFMPRKR